MAIYKLIQDIEAEDKLLGPLTLKQFIYAAVAVISLYFSFLSFAKHATFLLIFFAPVAAVSTFFAWPWSLNQPTEVWALAKIRFLLKPHRRIWDQSGANELVTIAVPKTVQTTYSNGLTQPEVSSRLQALAEVIDSRGWAIKNVNLNLSSQPQPISLLDQSDRLINPSVLPQEVPTIDIQPADDILDEVNNPVALHFDQMINTSTQTYRQQIRDKLKKATGDNSNNAATTSPTAVVPASSDYLFMNAPNQTQPATIVPTENQTMSSLPTQTVDAEEAVTEQLKKRAERPELLHMRTFNPFAQHATPQPTPLKTDIPAVQPTPSAQMTPSPDPAILGFVNNNDLNVATIARQINQPLAKKPPQDEVVIPLR